MYGAYSDEIEWLKLISSESFVKIKRDAGYRK